MTHIGRLTVAVALPLVALATAAEAQLAGIPVYYSPRGGTGVGVAANAGFPNNDAGGGTAYGVAGSFGTGPVTLTAMVGAYKGAYGDTSFASAQLSFGGTVSYRLLGGGFLPVAIAVQGGYGMVKALGVTTSTIPVGVGISLDPPLFPFKPWLAPRIEFTSLSGVVTNLIPPTRGNVTGTAFRVSAGVNFNMLLGLGVHAAVDYGQRPAKLDPNLIPTKRKSANTMIIGVGAHFNFHVPMM